jgi:acetyl-CoA C-acetyltransferase
MTVSIVGVGLHPFGRFEISGREMGLVAARAALADAGVAWSDVGFAAGGSRDSGHAAALVSELGLTGVPFIGVYNGCGTAGSAVLACRQAIESGAAEIALAVGFDKHARGAFGSNPADYGLPDWYAEQGMMVTTQFFALKIRRYLHDHGLDPKLLAEIAAKALRNGSRTPHAWRRKPVPADEIASAPMVNDPLTSYMFCSPSEGGAAVVLMSTERARQVGPDAVEVKALEFRTRRFGTFEVFSPWLTPEIAEGATVHAARAAFEAAGIGPDEIDVAQLQDTEAGAELMHLAECGFCAHGEQDRLVRGGELEIGGRFPVNTDGGLIANGEPIGASGLRQVHELVRQLRGEAGDRQVPGDPRIGLAQVYGAPGTASATILSL